ncbi:YceI family protein [Kiloniella antarctica]|uniref:YceI family protein n=1 Tax=Kiloniella antarctica TaxID=1550907 RepID=A0ABW5BJZ1_9PROT
MFKSRFVVPLVLSLLLVACGSLIPSGQQNAEISQWKGGAYTLDPDHASLIFSINHLGFSSYIGRFNRLDSSLDFDPENPEKARLSARVMIDSLDVNNSAFAEDLKGPSWFNAKEFPSAYFESTEIKLTGDKQASMIGNLTLKGVTKPVTFDVSFNGGADNFLTGKYTLGFEARGIIKRSEFGVTFLVPAISDEVELKISTEFLKVSS